MRIAVRLVLISVLVLVAIVVVQRISAGQFETAYRERLSAAQQSGLVPQTSARTFLRMRTFRQEMTALAVELGGIEPARADTLLAAFVRLDGQAKSLMSGEFAKGLAQGAEAEAPRIELAAPYFAALDALDLGGAGEPSAQFIPGPYFLGASSALWLAGVDAERLGKEPGRGALAARRLAQVFALQHHVDEGSWEQLHPKLEQEDALIETIVRAGLLPHADPGALFEELDPWLAHCADTERFIAALRGEFLREYDELILPVTYGGPPDEKPQIRDREWRRALCRIECLEDCVRGLTLSEDHVDHPERNSGGRIVPPRPPGGDPTHELVDMELAAQRHRRKLTMVRVALAIAAYQAAEGVYPPALSDLAELFDGAVPVDPADGLPFGYRVEPGLSTLQARSVGGKQNNITGITVWEQRAR